MNFRPTLILASALVALAFVPGTASARLQTDEQRLAYFLPVAERAFPSPCVGHETIQIRADFPVEDVGLSWQSTCTIYLRPEQPDLEFCYTLAHEMGHLAGLQHTTDGGIMDPDTKYFAPCVDATARSMTTLDQIRDLFPNGFVKAGRVPRASKAFRHGVRWVVVTRTSRFYVRMSKDGMEATEA